MIYSELLILEYYHTKSRANFDAARTTGKKGQTLSRRFSVRTKSVYVEASPPLTTENTSQFLDIPRASGAVRHLIALSSLPQIEYQQAHLIHHAGINFLDILWPTKNLGLVGWNASFL